MLKAISKTGYQNAITGKIELAINTTADGNIAQSGDTVTGKKQFTLSGVKAENTKTDNDAVANVFIFELIGGTYEDKSMEIKWGV